MLKTLDPVGYLQRSMSPAILPHGTTPWKRLLRFQLYLKRRYVIDSWWTEAETHRQLFTRNARRPVQRPALSVQCKAPCFVSLSRRADPSRVNKFVTSWHLRWSAKARDPVSFVHLNSSPIQSKLSIRGHSSLCDLNLVNISIRAHSFGISISHIFELFVRVPSLAALGISRAQANDPK